MYVAYSSKLLADKYVICDRILENSSKSHMKSSVFLQVFNNIYPYVFTEYIRTYQSVGNTLNKRTASDSAAIHVNFETADLQNNLYVYSRKTYVSCNAGSFPQLGVTINYTALPMHFSRVLGVKLLKAYYNR